MLGKKTIILMALLVLAIFAVGSVSAADNITADSDVPTDDITVDDVSVDGTDESGKVVEPTRALHDVTYSDSVADINQAISDASTDSSNHIVNFAQGTYYNAAYTVQDNVVLDGHGSTLIGDGTNDIFLVTNCQNFTIKNFIININCSSAAAVYGHHVYDAIITNNTMYNGRDGINIFQVHENLTITDNNISDFNRDGISLVNFLTMDNATWDAFTPSTIRGNIISCNGSLSGDQYGMFFGGNFKGVICSNNISGADYGIEFAGKRAATNGRLNVTICNTNITDVSYGIHLNHPGVEYLSLCNVQISSSVWDIITGANFVKTGHIYVDDDCVFNGNLDETFVDNIG